MKPFESRPSFCRQFPSPEDLKFELLTSSNRTLQEAIARQWLTEGLPRAFITCPGIYEDIRGWLGVRLKVHAKEITLVGSARTGFSFANFGRPFDQNSDLDLCVVSNNLFQSFRESFDRFAADLASEDIRPRNDREGAFWQENIEFGKRNFPKGFFDANKLPTFDRYEVSQRIQQAMWMLRSRLELTPGAPRVRSASIRIYRDWQALIERLTANLRSLTQKLQEKA
jgi:hypothetical protein